MSPYDAIQTLTARFDRAESNYEVRIAKVEDELDTQGKQVSSLVTEMTMTRKSLDRFTTALIGASVTIVGSAVAIIYFGG